MEAGQAQEHNNASSGALPGAHNGVAELCTPVLLGGVVIKLQDVNGYEVKISWLHINMHT